MTIPTYDNLFNPVINALHKLGGVSSIAEIEEKEKQIIALLREVKKEV